MNTNDDRLCAGEGYRSYSCEHRSPNTEISSFEVCQSIVCDDEQEIRRVVWFHTDMIPSSSESGGAMLDSVDGAGARRFVV